MSPRVMYPITRWSADRIKVPRIHWITWPVDRVAAKGSGTNEHCIRPPSPFQTERVVIGMSEDVSEPIA